jgi:hypothetical protein
MATTHKAKFYRLLFHVRWQMRIYTNFFVLAKISKCTFFGKFRSEIIRILFFFGILVGLKIVMLGFKIKTINLSTTFGPLPHIFLKSLENSRKLAKMKIWGDFPGELIKNLSKDAKSRLSNLSLHFLGWDP